MRDRSFLPGGQVSTEWKQMSRLRGTACCRQSGPLATKINRLDSCEDREVVCWCTTQASCHDSQGVVDGRVNDAVMSTAAPDRRAVRCW